MGTRPVKALNSGIVGRSNGSVCEGTRRFGIFELDLRAGELRRQGMRVKLQEQPFQLLVQLLENPGEVVTREELRNRLWPADTFVDFDHSLNAAIRRLRDAIPPPDARPRRWRHSATGFESQLDQQPSMCTCPFLGLYLQRDGKWCAHLLYFRPVSGQWLAGLSGQR